MTTPNAVDMWTNADSVDTWRRHARLHNALVPNLYAYAHVAHETGIPTMRHMVLQSPNLPEALQPDYQYLLGNELLVAPVVEPGATTRRLWLPEGTWFSFWDDTHYDGPGYVEVPAPIEQIPLLVRGGTILPQMATPVVTLASVGPDDLSDVFCTDVRTIAEIPPGTRGVQIVSAGSGFRERHTYARRKLSPPALRNPHPRPLSLCAGRGEHCKGDAARSTRRGSCALEFEFRHQSPGR